MSIVIKEESLDLKKRQIIDPVDLLEKHISGTIYKKLKPLKQLPTTFIDADEISRHEEETVIESIPIPTVAKLPIYRPLNSKCVFINIDKNDLCNTK